MANKQWVIDDRAIIKAKDKANSGGVSMPL